MMTKPKILIITGYGLNCEAESTYAWEQAGAEPVCIHLNDLIEKPDLMHTCQALMFIGGFSFGDHMGSGLVFALKVKHRLQQDLDRFIREGKLILGVCNGFQVMVKIGLLPGFDRTWFEQRVALMQNDCGHFQNYWVSLRFEESPCVFTAGLDRMMLPIRHGEGKLYTPDQLTLTRIEEEHCVPCRYVKPATGEPAADYPDNPNGSLNSIAGLCDPSGRIFGLMPHPEAFLFPENHPQWPRQKTKTRQHNGLKIFTNAVTFIKNS